MSANLGELAALLTAICFSASSMFFSAAGKRFGALVSNRIRLAMAVILVGMAHWAILGTPFPAHAGSARWLWLGLSGIVGLAIGDLFLFRAYNLIGPRLGLLFLSLSPALAALLAWIFLGEGLSLISIVGIIITLAGITWVVLESSQKGKSISNPPISDPHQVNSKGVLAGLIAATGQALGLVLAKNGLVGNFPALSGTLMRMITAFSVLWVITLFQRQVIPTLREVNSYRPGLLYLLGGSIFGPMIGVTLSLYAVQYTKIGIASTLIALPPVFMLPLGHFVLKEHITWKAILGTLLAIAGVSLLFLL